MTTVSPSSRSIAHHIADQTSSMATRTQKTAWAMGNSAVNQAAAIDS